MKTILIVCLLLVACTPQPNDPSTHRNNPKVDRWL